MIYSNEFCSLTSTACNQTDNNYIVVGSQAGSVYLIDRRQPNEFVDVFNCFEKAINRITFNAPNQYAICGNTNKVLVLNGNIKLEKIYENNQHSSIVRDVKWFNGELYSCGFNKSIIQHVL